ncbi:ubiquinol-cytochrome c reductase core subunit 1 [Myotisia sp. PD_48]|nr:ubiquinol-cytochrome c reductase core subunit 1 [Myotisia sp. PD_48]
MMLPRASIGRNAARALRCNGNKQTVQRRGMAAAAAQPFEYAAGESAGVKLACRELPGPTSTLTVVAKGGSRYEPFQGYAEVLEKFAFKSTLKRSALRITRETELLGGELSASHSREGLVLSARFLTSDLPYYAELLAEVASKTKYAQHELDEVIFPLLKLSQASFAANPTAQALDSAHTVAFHKGLGNSLTPSYSTKNISAEGIADFAKGVYTKPSIAVVSNGANAAEVSKWVGQFFADVPATGNVSPSQQSQYFGGEQRVPSQAGNAIVLAFPGSSAFGTSEYKPELSVLASLLGGQSSIKWSTGSTILAEAVESISGVQVSTKNAAYSDNGLFHITISGSSASSVAQASRKVVESLKKVAAGEVAAEDVKKAVALSKFRALDASQSLSAGDEVTGSSLLYGGKPFSILGTAQSVEKVTDAQLKAAAKNLLASKASVATVGDLFSLPYASDLGLTV